MWNWIKQTFDTLAKYFLDLFVWFFEFVFWIFDEILRFLWGLIQPFIGSMFDALNEKLPDGVVGAIRDSYVWLEYINEWVPIEYAIKLFVAYFAIACALFGFRVVLAFLPFGGQKI